MSNTFLTDELKTRGISTVDPTSNDGIIGGFWINTTTMKVFGPKTSNGWGVGVLLNNAISAPTTIPTIATAVDQISSFAAINTIIGLLAQIGLATSTVGQISPIITGSPLHSILGNTATFTPTITNGTPPYTLSVSAGTLPTGRSLTGNAITGTYNATGTFHYTLRVDDSVGGFGTLSLTEAVINTISMIEIGDSIAAGNSAFKQMGYGSNVTLNNADPLSVPGTTLLSLTQGALGPGGYGQYYDPTSRNIAVFQRGTNDFGNNNSLPADVYGYATAEILKAKNAGFVVILCTVLKRTGTSQILSNVAAYNTLVRANTAGADFIIDFDTNPNMGSSADPTDTTKWADGLHPTSPGQVFLIPSYKAACDLAIAAPVRIPTLQTLQLDRSIFRNNPSTGSVLNFTYGSTIVSGVPGLVVNNEDQTFQWDGTGATGAVADGLVETLNGDVKSSPITVSGLSSANYLRLVPRRNIPDPVSAVLVNYGTGWLETGDIGVGYTYTPAGDFADGGSRSGAGMGGRDLSNWPTKSLAQGASGWIQMIWPAPSPNDYGVNLGFMVDNTLTNYTNQHSTVQVTQHPVYGPNYRIETGSLNGGAAAFETYGGSGDNPTVVAAGDVVRITRTIFNGTITGVISVSKDNGTNFTVVHTVNGLTDQALYPIVSAGHGGSYGTIKKLQGSLSIS